MVTRVTINALPRTEVFKCDACHSRFTSPIVVADHLLDTHPDSKWSVPAEVAAFMKAFEDRIDVQREVEG